MGKHIQCALVGVVQVLQYHQQRLDTGGVGQEPGNRLQQYEREGDFTSRLALLEESKCMPYGAVWDYYCLQKDVPVGMEWMKEVKHYERDVLSARG